MAEPLTTEQREAVCCRHRDILVEAGAGTGKTSTTIRRYGRLLGTRQGHEDCPGLEPEDILEPSQILVFTFTDKAATELRNRIRDIEPDTPGQDGVGNGFSMGSAWVGTFHSICARILRSHPVLADVDPRFKVLSEVQAERMKQAAYGRALKEATKVPEQARLLSGYYPPTLREGVSSAYGQLRARGILEPGLPEAPPVDLGAALSRIRELAAEARATGGIPQPARGRIEKLHDYLAAATPESLSVEEFDGLRFGSSIDSIACLIREIKDFATTLATAEIGERSRDALDALLRRYGAEYASLKRSVGLLDYEDLQLYTVGLLRENAGVAGIYRERFREIMVDEFQDTNQLQLDLIETLRGETTTLFTVGDEMQAIYGFRHADVRLFRARRDDDGVKRLSLSANFRSQYPVIGAVNEIGTRLDEQASGGTDEKSESGKHKFNRLRVGLEPGADQGEGRVPPSPDDVELLLTTPDGWAELDLGPLSPAVGEGGPVPSPTDVACQAEALALARHIKSAIDNDGFRPADVAILFRYRKRKWMYAEALRQVGLKPYVIGGSGFWQTREGIDLTAMLGVVANPRDDESLLPALTGMPCGLSSDAIWMLRRESGYDEPLWPSLTAVADGQGPEDFPGEDHERARRFVGTIRGIREALATMPLESVVEQVVTGTGYDLACTIRGGAESMANVRQVASLAGEFEESEGRNLRGFLDWAAVSSEIDSEAAVATEEEDSDVIRLMTVHKAKGLEFEMVCLAELGRKWNTSGEKAFWVGTPPEDPKGDLTFGLQVPKPRQGTVNLYDWNLLSDAARRESADEELRLFHVGLTRAKRRLVLSGVDKLASGKGISESANTIHRVVEAFGIDAQQPELIEVPAAEPGVRLKETPTATRVPITRITADPDEASRLRQSFESDARSITATSGKPPLHNRPRTRHPDVPLSFTALDLLERCSARFYATRVLKLDEPDRQGPPLDPETLSPNLSFDSTRFGSAVHDLLERSANRRWVLPGPDEVRAAMRQRRVEDPEGLLAVRASAMIEEFAGSPLGERVRSDQAEVEVPLLIDILGVTVRGFVDLLLPQSRPPLLIDYKSNQLKDASPESKMEEYTLQRDLYGLAVARATDSPSVETAFVFLEDPTSPATLTLGSDQLDSAQTRLEGLVQLIREGSFFGENDTARPCRECWACEVLGSRISP